MGNMIQNFFHYAIVLLLVILWSVMMFFPEYVETMDFKIFFCVSVACAMIYSFCRKKYFPMLKYCRAEKIIFVLLIILLFMRLIFWKNQY